MNLRDPVVILVDDISPADLVRMTANGMAIDRRDNNAKHKPAQHKERPLQPIIGKHAPPLLLQMIAILY
jgi:hypothetical protein